MKNINELALKFKGSRDNLLLVVVFTTINLLLAVFGADVYLLFSAAGPLFTYGIGLALDVELGNIVCSVIALVIALIIIGIYFACWRLTKRKRVLILVAFILFSLDSLLFIFLMLADGNIANYILDIVFHGWVMLSLYNGVKAWHKLKGVSVEEFDTALEKVTVTENKILQQIKSEEETVNEDNKSKKRKTTKTDSKQK